jgi:hypothetical protein
VKNIITFMEENHKLEGMYLPIHRVGSSHKAAVVCGIRTEDGGKFAFNAFGIHGITL